MAGYLTGADQAVQTQANQAFQLKLQNAQMETEHNNRMAEMAQQSQLGTAGKEQEETFAQGLNSVPESQMNAISNYANDASQALRDRKPFPAPPTGITHPAAQQMLERTQGMLAHASAAMLPVSIHPINANGHEIVNVYDKGGNLVSQNDNGLNSEGSAAVKKAESAYGTYNSQLLGAESELHTFINANSAGKLPGQIANITLEKFMQDNPNVKAYFDQLPLAALKGEVDLTHSARAVQALGQSAQQAYPQGTDTVGVAQQKLNNLKAIGRDGLDATYQSYGVPVKQQAYPNLPLQSQLGQQKQAQAQQGAQTDNTSRAARIAAAIAAQGQGQQ